MYLYLLALSKELSRSPPKEGYKSSHVKGFRPNLVREKGAAFPFIY